MREKFKCCKLTLWCGKIKRNKNTRRPTYCMAVDRRKCLRQKFAHLISKTFKVVISKTSYVIMDYEILAQNLLRPLLFYVIILTYFCNHIMKTENRPD